MPNSILPRGVRLLAALALTTAVLAGCGDDDDPAASASSTSTTAASSAFPVTLKHQFGETTIEREPQRVVTIGFNEDDYVLALGVKPVGVRTLLGTFDADDRVWAQEALAGAKPEKVGGNELELEKIAALRPDLIMGVYSYIDRATYDALSKIAPTVAATRGDRSDSWQDQTLITGRALGKQERAKELVSEVEAKFAQVREEHPDFEGKTLAYTLGFEENGTTYSLEETDLRTQIFTGLGFEIPEEAGELSRERLDLIDEDVLVTAGATPADQVPVIRRLDVVKERRVVDMGDFDTELNGAIGYSSPLSLPRALDLVAPRLQAALEGKGT
jgi:iron complex transport system substrate-binding protein